jgi:hypothetical protein
MGRSVYRVREGVWWLLDLGSGGGRSVGLLVTGDGNSRHG